MNTIREFRPDDWPALWRFMEPVLRAGETYSFDRNISAGDAFRLWVELPAATFVLEDDAGELIGTYYIKPNQPGQGAHVCNCGYIVAEAARGRGAASALCEHSRREALRRGFRAMQFNMVASTNKGAIRLWRRHGFHVAGTLPGAFRHPVAGFVDAYVMYKTLVDG